jgi:hypothetical protein
MSACFVIDASQPSEAPLDAARGVAAYRLAPKVTV